MGSNSKTNVLPIIQMFPVDRLAEIFLLSVSARLPPLIHLSAEPPVSAEFGEGSLLSFIDCGLQYLSRLDMKAFPEGFGENNSCFICPSIMPPRFA